MKWKLTTNTDVINFQIIFEFIIARLAAIEDRVGYKNLARATPGTQTVEDIHNVDKTTDETKIRLNKYAHKLADKKATV